VSDTPLPNAGLSDAEIADQYVQREWDRFAMPDLSEEREPHLHAIALPAHHSSTAPVATSVYDSLPSYDSSTALGDAFAKAQSQDLAEEDTSVPHDHRAP